ncbi:MAG: beta-lactamase family protein [Bacilli bacterium]|nr:beta-lactamase family protein [Bacilli bacterium]
MFKFVKPETVGYNSSSLKELRDKLDNHNLRIHTLMIAKGDNVFFNINNGLYNERSIHRMYSETKSFVGLAIGLLYDNKKIKLTDKLSKYFPEYIDKNTDKVLLNQTIEDTLRMGTCVTCDDWFTSSVKDRVKLYFKQKHNRKCMDKFEYDTAGSMVLSALVEKIAKKDLFTFLYERILKHLKYFDDAYILKTPDGRTWGDSGMMCSTIATLALGRFLLNKGKVGNKQLLSKEYIIRATKKYLPTSNENARCKRYGYGYQIWMSKGGYAFLGMGNQVTIMYPKLDIVVSMTGNAFDKIPYARDYIFDEVYKVINKKEKLTNKIVKYNNTIDVFKNKRIDKSLLKKYSNKVFENVGGFIKSFKLTKQGISFLVNKKIYLVKLKDNQTTKTTIKDIYSKERAVRLPKGDTYNLYVGVEESSANRLLLQGQVIGDYFAIIKLEIIFKENSASLILKTYAENFFKSYNGAFQFKLV